MFELFLNTWFINYDRWTLYVYIFISSYSLILFNERFIFVISNNLQIHGSKLIAHQCARGLPVSNCDFKDSTSPEIVCEGHARKMLNG